VGLYVSGLWPSAIAQVAREPVSQPLGAATHANVTIAMGIGELRIGALDQPGALVAGQIAYPNQNQVTRTFAINGDIATFTLREQDSQANSPFKYGADAALWDLRLNRSTPMSLALETGVGNGVIDLAQLHVTDLTLKTGIGNNTLTLPRQGQMQARIEGGVGNTTIRIPAGVAVRVESSAGIGTISIPKNYWQQGNVSVSQHYETADNRVDLTISGAIGNIVIQQISE
jgi:Cell wall-active antibiotics response 4TMS YvqF